MTAKKKKKAVKSQSVEVALPPVTTFKELDALQEAIHAKRQELKEATAKENLSADDLATVKGIWDEYQKLFSTHKIKTNVTVEIELELENNFKTFEDFVHGVDGYALDPLHLYNHEAKGKLSGMEGLSKKQQKLLQNGFDDLIRNACGEIVEFLPTAVSDTFNGLDKTLSAVEKKLNKSGLEVCDLATLIVKKN